jgi:hypothetical protein
MCRLFYKIYINILILYIMSKTLHKQFVTAPPKYIIDTNIGDDIDDAFAIAL